MHQQRPTFLPLTATAAPAGASELRHCVAAADATAVDCWAALLGGCQSAERRSLPSRLRELTDATSTYVGDGWWCGRGAVQRRKVVEAQSRIDDAVRDGDGAEFAEAFVGYDQAIATAVVSVPDELESPTP